MFFNHHDTYESLAQKYSGGSPEFYTVNGLTLDMVNQYRIEADAGFGTFPGPWIDLHDSNGVPVIEAFYDPPPDPPGPGDPIFKAQGATWALAGGVIYATLVSQTFTRAFEFGHYGRKKKG